MPKAKVQAAGQDETDSHSQMKKVRKCLMYTL